MSENAVNNALRTMGYDTKTDICGHGFRSMACSALIESGLWSETAIERQMNHKERNNVRAAYIHKAEFIEERRPCWITPGICVSKLNKALSASPPRKTDCPA
jgi:integrase